jgi:hypothetical protein
MEKNKIMKKGELCQKEKIILAGMNTLWELQFCQGKEVKIRVLK